MFFFIEDNFKWPWFHYLLTEPESNFNGEVKTIKPSLIEEIQQDIKSTLQDDVRMVVREIEDQKTRAMMPCNNLYIYSLRSASSYIPSRNLEMFSQEAVLSSHASIVFTSSHVA
jgi:hypothetical protein